MREDAVNHHRVEGYDYDGTADGEDGGHGDGDALLFRIRIVKGPILEGEGLVEGLDLVDDHEDGEEDAAVIRKEVVCNRKRGKSSQDDDIVEDVTRMNQLVVPRVCLELATHENMTLLGRRFLENGNRSGSLFEAQSSMIRLPHPAAQQEKSPKLPQARSLVETSLTKTATAALLCANVDGVGIRRRDGGVQQATGGGKGGRSERSQKEAEGRRRSNRARYNSSSMQLHSGVARHQRLHRSQAV